MTTIEYSKVVGAGAGWTKVQAADGRTMTVKGDRAVRNNNPGNLEYGPFAKSMGAIGADNKGKRARGFAVFSTREEGLRAQAGWYAKEAKKHPDMTIGQAISKYAPAFENNTKAYTAALTAAGGITADTKLSDISPEQMQSVLSAQHAVEGNTKAVAYDAATGTRIATLTPSQMAPTQIAEVPQAAPAQSAGGLLSSFFADPLGMRAQAAEMPGLAAYAAPEAQGLLGPTGYDPAKNPAKAQVDAMFADNVPSQPVPSQPALSQPTFDARFAAQPTAAQFDARFGAPATAAAERFAPGLQAPAGPFSPENYAEATAPSSARARAAFDAVASSIGAPDLSTPASSLGAAVGSMVGPAPEAQEAGPRMSPDGRVADPFGNYVDKGPLGTVQKAETERMPGAALAYGEESQAPTAPTAAPTAPNGLGAYAGPTASLSPDMMGVPAFTTNMAQGMTKPAWDTQFKSLQPPEDPQIAEIAGNTIADPTATYPDAPTPENTFPEAPPEPEESLFGPATKRGLLGLALGGPVGGLLGYASGKLGGLGSFGNTALGPASAGERFGVGSGLAGIQAGMYGDRGATGYSRSNPNTSVTSRGRNLGYDITNQYGAVTHYDANGNMAGATPSVGLGGFLGGLFGGGNSKRDKDKDRAGKGLGGINGSGYSGNGLY